LEENYQKNLYFNIIFVLLIFLLWYVMGVFINSELILPLPYEVIKTSINLLKKLSFWQNLFLTILRAIIGLSLSLLSSLILGLVKNKYFYLALRNIIDIFQSNPIIIWISLALIWFGFGTKTVIFTVIIMLFPNFYLSIYHAINNIPEEYKDLFKIYPVSTKDYYTKFLFPYLKLYILPVFINSLISSFKIVTMAEFLSANNGIGYMLSYSKTFLNTKEIYAYALYLFIMSKTEEKILGRFYVNSKGLEY